MDDKEFLSLDLEGAQEYLLAYATTLKRYDQDLAVLDQDIALWKGRVALAQGRSQAALTEAATAKVAELEEKRKALEAERAPIAADLVRLKERLPYLKSRERSVDPDLLLAELQAMNGSILDPETASAQAAIEQKEKEARAEDALAELKHKIGGQA